MQCIFISSTPKTPPRYIQLSEPTLHFGLSLVEIMVIYARSLTTVKRRVKYPRQSMPATFKYSYKYFERSEQNKSVRERGREKEKINSVNAFLENQWHFYHTSVQESSLNIWERSRFIERIELNNPHKEIRTFCLDNGSNGHNVSSIETI